MQATEIRRGRRGSAPLRGLGLALVGAAALALAGCGSGDAAGSASVPVAEDCLQSWNSESASLTFGRHVYESHQSKQAQVTVLEPAKGAFTIAGKETCAVIFAVAESDFEYGDVGLVITKLGWSSMRELSPGNPARLDRIQFDATEAPNTNLFPDGTLEPR